MDRQSFEDTIAQNADLMHHGVKGQRWGVRRQRRPSTRRRAPRSQFSAQEKVKVAIAKNKERKVKREKVKQAKLDEKVAKTAEKAELYKKKVMVREAQNRRIALTTDETVTLLHGEKIMQGIIVKFGLIPNETKPDAKRTGGVGSTGRM